MKIWKIRIFWNETVFIFDFSKNMSLRLYIIFFVDKFMT